MQKIELFTMPDKNKRIANWIYRNGSAIAYQATDQLQIYHNTVLLQYILTPGKGDSLHFRTNVRLPERAYLFNPQTPCKIGISETFHLNLSKNTTSIPTSTKPTKIKHFTTFYTIKNHHYSTKNPLKALKIKHFLELNQNLNI